MKLDRQKLKEAIKKAESSEFGSDLYPGNAYPLLFTLGKRKELKCGRVKLPIPDTSRTHTWAATERQILYAIAAQARGHLSVQKKWVPRGDSTGGRVLVPFTKEMQLELIGDAMKLFERPEAAPAATEAPGAAPSAA